MLFVSAPLYVSAAREAFARVDRATRPSRARSAIRLARVQARHAAARPAAGSLAAAVVMWARAVSEFGAIVILTYNPKVASVLSYDRFTSFGLERSAAGGRGARAARARPALALRALRYAGEPLRARRPGDRGARRSRARVGAFRLTTSRSRCRKARTAS